MISSVVLMLICLLSVVYRLCSLRSSGSLATIGAFMLILMIIAVGALMAVSDLPVLIA